MKISIEKASGKSFCRYETCSKNPELIKDNGRIKTGTLCAAISIKSPSGWQTAFYCRECLEKVHQDVKMHLNPKLWCMS